MPTVPSTENRAARKNHLNWRYVVPLVLALLASCGSPPAPPTGTIEPINVPPHNSPIYSNQEKVLFTLAHESAQNSDQNTHVEVSLSGTESSGASCDNHLSSHFTQPTDEQRKNHITPFDVVVSSNGEEGLCSVSVKTRECIETSCSDYQDEPYTVDVVFDITPPQISVDANTPPGTAQGTATDAMSPVTGVSASYTGQEGELATSTPDTSGRFAMAFKPEVGPRSVTLKATDAAGNIALQQVAQDYEFNAGLNITSMQFDGKTVDLAKLSQTAGRQIQDGDLFVGMQLPEGTDPNTVSIAGDQTNWRYFGLRSTFTCDRFTHESYDVAFSCTPSSKSGDKAQLKFTFTDKYGYSFDMYYPQESFFTVDTRAMSFGEMAWYITERAVAVLAGLSLAGLTAAAVANRRQYEVAYQSAAQLAFAGKMGNALQKIDETTFLTSGQKSSLEADIRAQMEAQKKAQLVAEHKELINRLYIFPGVYDNFTGGGYVPHDALQEAIGNLNRALQLGFNTNYLNDVRGRYDAVVVLENFTLALDRWMQLNFVNPATEAKNDWKELENKWGANKPKIELVLQSIFALETRQTHSALWSQLKKGRESSKDNLKTIGLLYAYNHGLLFRSGKMRQDVYTSLITHNEIPIEEVISTLMKWGSIGVADFIGAIHDSGERARAEKHFKSFIHK